jgi:DNA-binding MarR family transcriptional regulator
MTDLPNKAAEPSALEAWTALLRTERALQDKIEEDLKRAQLPPLDWFHVLDEIASSAHGALRQSTLQGSTKLAQYNVCRLIDRLEGNRLVARKSCPLDARNNVVAITAAGRETHARMAPVYAVAAQAHLGTRLTATETALLRDLLAKLHAG